MGKLVKLSLEARTEGIDGGACVAKAQRMKTLQYAGFLASDLAQLPTAAKGFTRCKLRLMCGRTKWILYGFTYRGAGKAWARRPSAAAVAGDARPPPKQRAR